MNKLWMNGLSCVLFLMAGCSTVPKTVESRAVQSAEVRKTIAKFQAKDPKVLKGGFWIGGAHGKGEVFEQNRKVGYCSMSQATLGFSFGGEYFREIIFFRDKVDLDMFKSGDFTFAAQVTGVALSAGAASKVDYQSGMAVFVMPDAGLMVDASLGGQKFKYVAQNYVTGQQ